MLHRTVTTLLAVVLMFSFFITGAAAKKEESDQAFAEFERLLPLAIDSANEASAASVRKALKESSPWMVIAAVEAVRQAHVSKNSGKVFLPDILALMTKEEKKLHETEIVTVNLLACLGTLVRKDDAEMLTVVRALIEWQRWSNNEVVRLRHMAERVLSDLTEEDCTLRTETITFWEWWVQNKAAGQDTGKAPEKRSKTAPVLFKEPMVGTRVVFVIDVSDSMKWPIHEKDLPKLQKKIPHLDWKALPVSPSPMDLAKAELAYSIDKLRPEKGPDGKPVKRGTKRDLDPEARHFSIITYSTEVNFFTETGWVEATDTNCNTWITEVEKLETEHTTNIHGGLVKAFGLSDERKETPHPEVDRDCVLTGAHTIVFLTDGYPTWSDDSTATSAKDEFGNPVGDGEYVKRDKLIELAAQLNRFRKVVINTVGIGIHDKKLMMAFAKNSGGGYTDWGCEIDYGQSK